MHGQGKFIWANKDTYVGSWRNGRMHGYRVPSFFLAARQTLMFAFCCPSCSFAVTAKRPCATVIHTLGYRSLVLGRLLLFVAHVRFVQMWKDDKANGYGVKVFECGDKHEGQYVADKRHEIGRAHV